MAMTADRPAFSASRIEDEPILGPVLVMRDGGIVRLNLWERLLVSLHLVDARRLEAWHARAA